MKLIFKFLENELFLYKDKVLSLEVENKAYFYRIVECLNGLAIGEKNSDIGFYNESFDEINLVNKANVIVDYFNIELNSKKTIAKVYKMVEENIDDKSKLLLSNSYNKILSILKNQLNEFDVNIQLDDEFKIESLLKLVKLKIMKKEGLIDNLFLLIDIEKTLNINNLLIFVNLKEYLSKQELIELEKYIIYNELYVIFVDIKSNGSANEFENKLLIDDDLVEFML